ncbi:MAG: DUF5060 domain-containing protein, partial [Planctomycetes bacterium]|nr:DUF5060 domain-containing protein [Planctomycetota bacterium]
MFHHFSLPQTDRKASFTASLVKNAGLFLGMLMLYFCSASLSAVEPTFTAPANAATLSGPDVTVTWDNHGVVYNQQTINVGTSPYSEDIGSFGGATNSGVVQRTLTGMPTDGSTIYLTMYNFIDGNYAHYAALSLVCSHGSSGPDVEAPSQPQSLALNILSDSQIDLTWNASTDNVAVSTYNIYRDGSLINSSSITSFSDSGLTASTNYSYQVSAVDSSANESTLSAVAQGTTQGPPSGGDPVFTSPANGATLSGADVTFTWNNNGIHYDAHWMNIGTTPFSDDIGSAGGWSGSGVVSGTVTGLPTDGSTIYVTMYNFIDGNYTNYSEVMVICANGSGGGPDTEAPSQVQNLALNVLSDSQIDLTWNASTDNVAVSSYNIFRDGSLLTSVSATSFSDSALSANTSYSYQVSAVDSSGNESAVSAAAQGTTQAPPSGGDPVFISPTNGATLSGSDVTFTWNNNGVHYSAHWMNIGTTPFSDEIGSAGGWSGSGVVSGTVTGLPTDGSTIYVTMYNFIDGNYTNYSEVMLICANGSGGGSDTEAPSQPQSLTTNVLSDSQIDLTWNASTDNVAVSSYNIYRDGSLVTSVSGSSFSDAGLTASTTYSYQVSAVDSSGNESALSVAAQDTTQAPPSGGDPIFTSPTHGETLSGADVTFTWNNNGVHYDAHWMNIGTTPFSDDVATAGGWSGSGVVSATVTALPTDGSTIYVTMYNFIDGNYTNYSEVMVICANGSGGPDTENPSQPQSLTTNVVSESQIDLTWNVSTDNIAVTGYNIYRDGLLLTSVSNTNYSDAGLTASTIYSYEVSAVDAAGNESALSTSAQGTTQTPAADTEAPTQPQSLLATALSDSQINLSWNAATDNIAVTAYAIYRDGSFIASVSGTGFSDSGLNASTSYSYQVTAMDAVANESAVSAAAQASTQAPPNGGDPVFVSPVAGSTLSGSSIVLQWNNNGIYYTAHTINIGTTPQGSDILSVNGGTGINLVQKRISALPTDGSSIYVTMYNFIDGIYANHSTTSFITVDNGPADVQAPSQVNNLSGNAVSAWHINLSWNAASDNVAVDSYNVYRNASLLANVSATSYLNTGLKVSTWYNYQVAAVDAAGNEGALSSIVQTSTLAGSGNATIDVNPGITYQTMKGWEIIAPETRDEPLMQNWIDQVCDKVVNEVGVNRVRLSVLGGSENDQDYYTQYMNGQLDYATWRGLRHSTRDDNLDPNNLNPNGYHFNWFDDQVRTVDKLKTLTEANGEQFYVNLCYVANTYQNDPDQPYHHDDAEEYAEFIVAVWDHLDSTYGWVPDCLEIMLEPDFGSSYWNEQTVVDAIKAVVPKLQAAGYPIPDISAPGSTSMQGAVTYINHMATDPEAMQYVTEFSYHRYEHATDANLQTIAALGDKHGKETAMCEWWDSNNGYQTLHKDVEMGMNSTWEQGVIGGTAATPMTMYHVDVTDPNNPALTISDMTKYTRQYFKYIRPGAVRIDANSQNTALAPLAFNKNGSYTVVVKADSAQTFDISGLPAGTYSVTSTTSSVNWGVDHGDVTITAGQNLNATIAGAGVITISAKAGGNPPAPSAVVDNFSSSASSIQAGQSATLSWQTTDATSVSIDNGLGAQVVDGSVAVSPTVTTTYILSAIGSGGNDSASVTITVNNSSGNMSAPSLTGHHQVFKIDITHSEAGYANLFDDVLVSATFTAPSAQVITVDGFYHSTDLWKVYFAPAEVGNYTWSVTVDDGSNSYAESGSFSSELSGEKGFLRSHPNNPHRLYYDYNNTIFAGIGWEVYGGGPISLLPPYSVGAPGVEDGFSLEGDLNVDVETYLTAMADNGGGRLVRLGAAGQGWLGENLWNPGLNPNVLNCEMTENFFIKCREHNVRIYFDIFGWEHDDHHVMSGIWRTAAGQQEIERYLKYINARFAAYVDIWELVNETSPEDAWMTYVGEYVKSIDPYNHMVSTSWERPEHASIDVNSPHIYTSPATVVADTYLIDWVENNFHKNTYAKPVILGELGDTNKNNNTDPWGDSTDRGRVWAYAGLFKEFYFCLWEANWVAGGQWAPGNGSPANYYFGPDERAQFNIHHDFAQSIEADVVMDNGSTYTSVDNINLYGLVSANSYYLYVKSA